MLLGFLPTAQAQIFVDADNTSGTQDGTSWATAYPSLRTAILSASAGDAIWVADGTYPTGTTRDNSFTFTGAKDGLQIYGGFQGQSRPGGGETALDQRDPDAYEAVLTGDVDGDGTLGGNAYHVFVLNGTNDPITRATVIDGVTITGGNASGNSFPINAGGGLLCLGEGGLCNPTIVGVTFRGNRAGFGGAMFNEGDTGGESNPLIANSVFVGNEATSNGAAMLNSGKGTNGESSPVIINTTFTGNTAGGNGGAMINNGLNNGRAEPQLTNVILWNNDATDGAELYNLDATPTLTHTLLEGGIGGPGVGEDPVSDGGGNLDADPLFVDADGPDDTIGTADDDVRLLADSPALDAGTTAPFAPGGVAEAITTDAGGDARTQGAAVDLGAFEGGEPRIWYVDAEATGAADGSSWTDAFTDLQDALAQADGGDRIWVAEGTYTPTSGTDRTVSFRLTGTQDGLKLLGGFAGTTGTERDLAVRDPAAHPTILSGDIDGGGDLGGNSYHVLFLDGATNGPITPATVIDGFTLTGGNANLDSGDFAADFPDNAGGGLFCDGAGSACSPTLTTLVFRRNEAFYAGGGLYNDGHDGGESSPVVANAIFVGNATENGGFGGGAVVNDGSETGLSGNGTTGGVSNPSFTNVTFVGNTGRYGGAMLNLGTDGECIPLMANTILWDNVASFDGAELTNGSANPVLTYSLVEGGINGPNVFNYNGGGVTDGGGNLSGTDAPLFVDSNGPDDVFGTADDDLRLFRSSPAIDAGVDSALPPDAADRDGDGNTTEPLPLDFAGEARIQDAAVDLGAFEGGEQELPNFPVGLLGVQEGGVAWGDVDGDGDLDLAVNGLFDGVGPDTRIYRNDGDTNGNAFPNFTELQIPLAGVSSGADVDWGDADGDGDLDLFVTGFAPAPAGSPATAYLVRNDGDTDGDGTPNVTTFASGALGVRPVHRGTADWGDVDGDGDLDLLIAGTNILNTVSSAALVAAVYRNDGDTSGNGAPNFVNVQAGLPGVIDAAAAWGDYNGDGSLDLVLTGQDVDGNRIARIYRNDGDTDGDGFANFTDINAGLLGVESGSVDWGDYDGDGDLDLVVTGRAPGTSTRVYRNDGDTDGNGTTDFAGLGVGATGLDAVSFGTAQWGDLDLDGDLDLLLTGLRSDGLHVTRLFSNEGDDTFARIPSNIVGGRDGDAAWGDFDGDGDLDAVVTGEDSDNREFIRFIRNDRLTTLPDDATTASVSGDERVDFGTTGLAIAFGPGTTPGSITVARFNTPPTDPDGLPPGDNVSGYRFLVIPDGHLAPGPGTTVRFDPGALGGITAPGDVTVHTRPALDAGPFAPLTTNVANGEIVATVTGFSEFVLTSPSDPLPVELTAFDAQQQPDAVLLTWQTAAETNNAGFEIQRRAEADWERVGFVEGTGTTTEPQTYRFRDAAPPFADSLVYRLKQIDVDGTAAYSDAITVARGAVARLELSPPFPNPVRQQATVRFAVPEGRAEDVTLQLYDLLGRRVASVATDATPGRHELTLNTSTLASGVYFLRLTAGGDARTQKVTIVR